MPGASSSVRAWLPRARPKTIDAASSQSPDDRRAGAVAVARGRPERPRRRAALAPSPLDQEHEDQRGEEDVERVRVGPLPEAPGDGRDRERDARQEAQRPAARGLHRRDGRSAAAPATSRPRAGSRGRPRCRRAGAPPRRARPAACRWVARGVGDAQHRPDGLELGGVPGAHVGQERGHVERQRAREGDASRHDERHAGGRRTDRRAAVGRGRSGRYHPSLTPHQTPQALMSTESATSSRLSEPDARAGDAERHEEHREGREVIAEAVAELDPALAEVHEVDERDGQHRQPRRRRRGAGASRTAGPASPAGRPGWRAARSCPAGRGAAAGQSRSKRSPRPWGARVPACRVVEERQLGRPAEHDARVLGDVAHVLDAPLGVDELGTRPVLDLVEVLVGGVEEGPVVATL